MSSEKIVTISWLERLKQSVGGMVFGLVLIVAMVIMLFWNEGRAVQTARSLAEGAGLVSSVSSVSVEPANEGKLIHLTGPVTASAPVADAEFSVSAAGLQLMRRVEMYQWVEKSTTEKKVELGGSETQVTKYSYEMQWSEFPQDSSKFNEADAHANPPMAIERQTFGVVTATLGGWSLDSAVIDRIGGSRDFAVPAEQAEAVQQAIGAGIRASVVEGKIYLGVNPSQPSLGDYRVSYQYVPLDTISVVGRQRGTGIADYQTESGDKLLIVHNGSVSAAEMFDAAASSNSTMTWAMRIAGIALLVLGFSSVFGPLSVAASVLPFLGSILAFGTGIIAAIAGVSLGSLTIAVAWFFYRPLVALAIIAVGAAIGGGLLFLAKRRKANAPAASA